MDSLKLSNFQGYDEEVEDSPKQVQSREKSLPYKLSVKWDRNNPEHCALYRVFGEQYIPLVEGTKAVDHSRVKKCTFKDSPSLNPTCPPSRSRTWSRKWLLGSSFRTLVQMTPPMALSKVGLAKDYQELICESSIEERTWYQVVVCLNKALKTELRKAHLAKSPELPATAAYPSAGVHDMMKQSWTRPKEQGNRKDCCDARDQWQLIRSTSTISKYHSTNF
ncbi:hypothetical protein BGZ70_005917, partial [Mortierella alpina]